MKPLCRGHCGSASTQVLCRDATRLGTGGGAGKADVEVAAERARAVLLGLDVEVLADILFPCIFTKKRFSKQYTKTDEAFASAHEQSGITAAQLPAAQHLGVPLVVVRQAELGEDAAGNEKAGAVRCK